MNYKEAYCKEAYSLINRYIDNDLNIEEESNLLQHIDQCARCTYSYRILNSTVKVLPDIFDTPCPEQLSSSIMESIRREKSTPVLTRISRFRDWRIYTSLAACVLLVFVIKGEVYKKQSDYLINNEPTHEYSSPAPIDTASPYTMEDGGNEVEKEDIREASPPPVEIASAPLTRNTPSSPPSTSFTEVGEIEVPSAPLPNEKPPESMAQSADNLEDKEDNGEGSAKEMSPPEIEIGGFLLGAPNDDTISAAGGGNRESYRMLSIPSTDNYINYAVPPLSMFKRMKITFIVKSATQSEQAARILKSSPTGDLLYFQDALLAAGIDFNKTENLAEDFTELHTEYTLRVDDLKSKLSVAEGSDEITQLNSQMEDLITSINQIVDLCAEPIIEIGL